MPARGARTGGTGGEDSKREARGCSDSPAAIAGPRYAGWMEEASIRVELMVREQCHLCEQARRVVSSVCEPAGLRWQEIDVDTDAEHRRRYGELVPVVLVDGVQVDYWQIDPSRLREALAGEATSPRRGLRGLLRRRRQD